MVKAWLATLFMGACAMLTAQEPKKDNKPWTETVTVKKWDETNMKFLEPKDGINAYRRDTKDGPVIMLEAGKLPGPIPKKGTVITDGDGVSWVLTKEAKKISDGNYPALLCSVEKEPKKKS